jgi:hypothetical protein
MYGGDATMLPIGMLRSPDLELCWPPGSILMRDFTAKQT